MSQNTNNMFKNAFKLVLRKFFFILYGKISNQKNSNNDKDIKITKISNLKPNFSKIKNYQIFEINNGRVFSDNVENVAIINKNIVLNKISFQQVDSFIKPAKYNSVIKEGTPKFIKKFKGNILILNQGSISNKNYCHWMLDVLPKIKISLKKFKLKEIDYFYVQNSLEFQKESLSKLKIPENKIINANKYKHIKAEKIIAISHHVYRNGDYILNSQKNQPQWSINWLKKTFVKNKETKKNKRRIFIDRSDSSSSHCKIINYKETIFLLKKYNFEILELSSLNLIDQINIFNNASIVVGVHGAGLTNLTFCKKKTKVIEIRNKPNPNKVFEKISQYNKLKYKLILEKEIRNHDDGDLFINIKNLEKKIKNFV
tara:strand:- start:276 stop:1388 length:1113 start_codon:yes stop_codon:yes gene_type:complete